MLAWRMCVQCRQFHLGGWHRTLLGEVCKVNDELRLDKGLQG
jgi:hypothetical protein